MTLNEVNEGRKWTVKEQKTEIDRRVKEIGVANWRMERKETLKWYKTKRMPKRNMIYDSSWAGQLLFKARTNSLEVNVRTRWNENRQRMCMQCGMGVDETVEHMLLKCERYANERKVLLEPQYLPVFYIVHFQMHLHIFPYFE